MKDKKKSSVFEKVEAEVMGIAGDYVKNKITRRFVKLGEFSILVLLSFIMISIGLAELIGFYFTEFSNGLNYIILGALFLIAGLIIRV
jgi:hypothetical protein